MTLDKFQIILENLNKIFNIMKPNDFYNILTERKIEIMFDNVKNYFFFNFEKKRLY